MKLPVVCMLLLPALVLTAVPSHGSIKDEKAEAVGKEVLQSFFKPLDEAVSHAYDPDLYHKECNRPEFVNKIKHTSQRIGEGFSNVVVGLGKVGNALLGGIFGEKDSMRNYDRR